MTDKLKFGFYGITGCAGCLLSVIFNEDDLLDLVSKIDIRSFPFIKEGDDKEHLDVIVLEGVVANNHDLETLLSLRERCDTLIALGACATLGGVPAFRNFNDENNFEHLKFHKALEVADVEPQPVANFVHVDYLIEGCPPNKKEILTFIDDIVLGKKPILYSKPVCVECRENKNPCLLRSNQPCLGPVTRGGCDSVCINKGLMCWGCRGPAPGPKENFDIMTTLLNEMGFTDDFVKDRLNVFAGWKHRPNDSKEEEK